MWMKSSYSFANGNCVEVDTGPSQLVLTALLRVRDSKDPDGPVLAFTPDEWRAFVSAVKAGEFA